MKDTMYVDSEGFCGYQELLKDFTPRINEILGLLQGVRR